jgi:hypothetical protein
MKKMSMVVISMAVLLVMSSMVYGQEVTTNWPPTTLRLTKALSCGTNPTNLCAIYLQTRGAIDVTCATKVDQGASKLQTFNCTLKGAIQTCKPGGVIVNMADTPSVKCQKICKPTCTAWK